VDRVHRADVRDLVTRAIAPGIGLWALIFGLGYLLAGPLVRFSDTEDVVSKGLAADRTSTWNLITLVWSHIGNTEIVIGVCVLVAVLILWRTHHWRLAVVPALALLLQAVIFFTTAGVLHRARPPVAKLDVAAPTHSFPSGHVSASTALYVSFGLLALHIRHTGLRWVTVVICFAVPTLVAFARLYRGMHHLTDVLASIITGIACALLAYSWYRQRSQAISGDDETGTR
jgi:membrane-associated phospholipid phosphatase